MGKRLNLIRKKFEKLTVIEYADTKKGRLYYKCRCDCGNIKTIASGALRSGHTRSCGCLRKNNHKTHGLSKEPEYSIWTNIRKRCLNPACKAFKNYGGRGIKICERWDDFGLFFKDMGKRPIEYTIERIDNDKGYSPKNCKWIPRNKQASNQRQRRNWHIKNKIFKTSIEASESLNVTRSTIWRWCKDPNKPDCYSEKRF